MQTLLERPVALVFVGLLVVMYVAALVVGARNGGRKPPEGGAPGR